MYQFLTPVLAGVKVFVEITFSCNYIVNMVMNHG